MKYMARSGTLRECAFGAFRPAMGNVRWLLSLMLPISLGVALLQHWGVLAWMAGGLSPMFRMMGLPGEAAVIFVSGASAGTYAGIAAMMAIPLTMRQATILGVMIALCHALPMECAVNRMTGSSPGGMALLRVVMAMVAAICLNAVLPDMAVHYIYMGAPVESDLQEVLLTWVVSQVRVSVVMVAVIYTLMVVQRVIESRGWLGIISRWLSPLMALFGLKGSCAYMWLVGNVLGISYGAAVMREMIDRKIVTYEEANDVNYHLVMNHSLLEDTIVFALTGISALWLVATRVLLAMAVVWGRRLMATAIALLPCAGRRHFPFVRRGHSYGR